MFRPAWAEPAGCLLVQDAPQPRLPVSPGRPRCTGIDVRGQLGIAMVSDDCCVQAVPDLRDLPRPGGIDRVEGRVPVVALLRVAAQYSNGIGTPHERQQGQDLENRFEGLLIVAAVVKQVLLDGFQGQVELLEQTGQVGAAGLGLAVPSGVGRHAYVHKFATVAGHPCVARAPAATPLKPAQQRRHSSVAQIIHDADQHPLTARAPLPDIRRFTRAAAGPPVRAPVAAVPERFQRTIIQP